MTVHAGIHPALAFDRKPAAAPPDTRPAGRPAAPSVARGLYCRGCRFAITDESQRVPVGGEYAHTRTNPHGVTFHFGCFADAPGCAVHGGATEEHTWFAGFRWRIAICRGCGAHLGWLFTGAGRFFGLILERLAAEAGRAA